MKVLAAALLLVLVLLGATFAMGYAPAVRAAPDPRTVAPGEASASEGQGPATDPLGGPRSFDPAGDSTGGPASDMLAAWHAIEDGELVVHWQVVSLDEVPPGSCWNLDFRVNGDGYWVLFARKRADGVIVAAIRDVQWLQDGSGTPLVSTDTRSIVDGSIPVEITPGEPPTLTVRYDSGVFPLRAGDRVQFSESMYSCMDNVSTALDGVTAAPAYVLPADTWRPAPAPRVFESLGAGGAVWIASSPCMEMELAIVGGECFDVPVEVRGSAYDLQVVPAIPVATAFGSPFAFHFSDDSGDFFIYGEPGGIPRRATQFEARPLVAAAYWRMETV